MGTEKPPRFQLGGFSCVVMLTSLAKHIIAQVPNEMQVIRCGTDRVDCKFETAKIPRQPEGDFLMRRMPQIVTYVD